MMIQFVKNEIKMRSSKIKELKANVRPNESQTPLIREQIEIREIFLVYAQLRHKDLAKTDKNYLDVPEELLKARLISLQVEFMKLHNPAFMAKVTEIILRNKKSAAESKKRSIVSKLREIISK